MIAIVDYGVGNLASIRNIIAHVGGHAEITRDLAVLADARGIIIPGVGAFDTCMKALRASGLSDYLECRHAEGRVPLLGICVGMQMMARGSDEGHEPGLGWIAGDVRRFPDGSGLKVPHMGWTPVRVRPDCLLFVGSGDTHRYYFVHSYHMLCDDPADVAAVGRHGIPFTAAVARGTLFGVQFHPEKSHRFGMRLFERFLAVAGEPLRHRASGEQERLS